MSKRNFRGDRRLRGFTLVELMVTVAIATVLMSVAMPAFLGEIRKSRRTEARTSLLDLAGRTERYYNTTNSYLDAGGALTPADLGYTGATWATLTLGNGYYTYTVAATATTFTFTATAAGGQTQDTQCATFTVDNTGLQSSADSSANPTTNCWQ